MVSGKVDRAIDTAIVEKLTTPDVLLEAVAAYNDSLSKEWSGNRRDKTSIMKKSSSLEPKRKRILESFYDGVISS